MNKFHSIIPTVYVEKEWDKKGFKVEVPLLSELFEEIVQHIDSDPDASNLLCGITNFDDNLFSIKCGHIEKCKNCFYIAEDLLRNSTKLKFLKLLGESYESEK